MSATALQSVARFFDRAMLYLILASIVLGLAFGLALPGHTQGLKAYINFTLFLMLYPMMVGIRVEQITKAAKNLRAILWSVLLNFIVSPLIGFLIARTLLVHTPALAVGLLLLSATPCAGMVAGWTGFARGNVPLSLVIVALSLTLSIVTIPLTMLVTAGSLVAVDAAAMFKGTLLVILLPLVAGDLTRRAIIAARGEPGFQAIRPLLPPLSMLGMFSIIFISVAMGAPKIVAQWHLILLIVPALVLFYVLQMGLSIWLAPRTGFAPREAVALVYAVVGKNVSLAVGLATHFFSPLTVTMLAINPMIQAPAMAWFLRWSTRHWDLPKDDGVSRQAATGVGGAAGIAGPTGNQRGGGR